MDILMANSVYVWGMASQGDGGTMNLIYTFLPFLIIIGIFYFLVIQPQKKRKEQHELMVSNLAKGDRVVTSGGIHGQISSVSQDIVKLNIARDINIEINRSAIARVKGKEQDES